MKACNVLLVMHNEMKQVLSGRPLLVVVFHIFSVINSPENVQTAPTIAY